MQGVMPMMRALLVLGFAASTQAQLIDASQAELTADGDIPDGFVVDATTVCKGDEVIWEECRGLPECTECACQPVNCEFGTWGDWGPPDGCNGICKRLRQIGVKNNECGMPCNGPLEDTKACIPNECLRSHIEIDCQVGPWSGWTQCLNGNIDQKERSRKILKRAEGGGKPCTDSLIETFPCGHSLMPLDCIMGDWQEWTECSVTCGGGITTRMRRPIQKAMHGGRTCGNTLLQTGECSVMRCGNAIDCVMTEWSEWTGCDGSSNDKYRRRAIEVMAQHGGEACPSDVEEVSSCAEDNNNCTFEAWTDWTYCDQTCGGGQTRRYRSLDHWSPLCTNLTTEVTAPCNTQSCTSSISDCLFGQWSTWGEPIPPCGKGVKDRKRKVERTASLGGVGCVGPLEEVVAVEGPECTSVDCMWGDWTEWSGCTASCGGGTHRRTRSIAIPPRHNGTLCEDKDFAEIQPCNTDTCGGKCVDGSWGLWGEWSVCSVSCGGGYRVRRREAGQVPNSCGLMQSGPREELEQCTSPTPCEEKVDCTLSSWGMWGECSKTCFGVRERNRLVEKFPMGGGTQCVADSLKDVEPCNPGWQQPPATACQVLPKHNCTLDTWTTWSECPVTCGGGQHTRMRHIIQPPSGGGMTCTESLSETRSCNVNKCGSHCIDCHWGQWSEWGACTECEGQKYRVRVVEQLPNHCGRRCDTKAAKETSPCSGNCTAMNYCVWSDWSAFTDCSATCGAASKKRQRNLRVTQQTPESYIFKGKQMMCAGTQFDTEGCENVPVCNAGCIPQNCVFGEWSEWQAPQCTGLCARQRVIRINNNVCGTPCAGDLVDTKRCNTTCDEPQDCLMGQWGGWSHCPTMYAQRYRVRVIKVEPANGGEQCPGALRETTSCMDESIPVVDCGFSDWSPWGACTKTCSNGWHYRTRSPNAPARSGAGALCEGAMKEIASCGRVSCEGATRDCQFSQWGAWSECAAGNQHRERVIEVEAVGEGNPCVGDITQLQGCDSDIRVDCQISPWTSWDDCDMTCGGGQQMRHRTIWSHPKFGGTPCPSVTMETQGCNTQSCGEDAFHNCSFSEWTMWGACSTTCGVGQAMRQRSIARERASGGTGCHDNLIETKECDVSTADAYCLPQDCKWEVWEDWNKCSKTCGGGQKKRHRRIKQGAEPGGRSCMGEAMQEIEPCNVRSCLGENCVDGVWGDWQPWQPCTQTCGGGLTWRSRQIAVSATDCGAAALGPEQEVAACNKHVPCDASLDCEFNLWGDWSACSSTCHGMKERKRNFRPGSGNGQWCSGALQEWTPCNPGPADPNPLGCPVPGTRVNCQFYDWEEWQLCSKTCGGGQATRNRAIKAKALLGGKSCVGDVTETGPCATTPCTLGDMTEDCKWQDWQDWAPCDKCAGTQRRARMIAQHATAGGRPCTPGNSKEVKECPRSCHDTFVCQWASWSSWTACSVTCGHGKRSRQRSLQSIATDASTTPLPMSVEEEPFPSPQRKYEYESGRFPGGQLDEPLQLKEIAGAFVGGVITVLVGLAAVRGVSAAWTGGRRGSEPMTAEYNDESSAEWQHADDRQSRTSLLREDQEAME